MLVMYVLVLSGIDADIRPAASLAPLVCHFSFLRFPIRRRRRHVAIAVVVVVFAGS